MERTVVKVDTIRKSIKKTPDFILLQKLLLFACTHTNNEIATSSGCCFCCGCCAIILYHFPWIFPMDIGTTLNAWNICRNFNMEVYTVLQSKRAKLLIFLYKQYYYHKISQMLLF